MIVNKIPKSKKNIMQFFLLNINLELVINQFIILALNIILFNNRILTLFVLNR